MDMRTLEKQIPRLKKEVRDKKTEPIVFETAKEASALLEEGELLSGPAGAALDQNTLKSSQFMTMKPFIFIFSMNQVRVKDEAFQ